jgi:hypothetical protein
VQSGDRGQWLWKYWEHFHRKYWNYDCGIDIVFIGETVAPDWPGVRSVLSGPGRWGDTVRRTVAALDYENVIFTHEDYVFTGPPNYPKIDKIMAAMDAHSLDLVKICGNWSGHMSAEWPMEPSDIDVGDSETLWKYHNNSMYLTSQQPSIWRRDFFVGTIDPDDTPWGHELTGTVRLSMREPQARIYSYRGEQIIPYAELSRAGDIGPGAERFTKEVDG